MTTIAYRDGVIAADSSATQSGARTAKVRKIYRVKGGLYGSAGLFGDALTFLEWLRAGAHEDEYPRVKELDAMVIDPKGVVRMFEGKSPHPIVSRGRYHAIGSGGPLALAAMFVGASARDAVRAACEHDTGSHGPVATLRLAGW